MVQSNINPVSEQEHLSSTLSSEQSSPFTYCSLPQIPEREFDPSVNPNRANLIQFLDKKWALIATLSSAQAQSIIPAADGTVATTSV